MSNPPTTGPIPGIHPFPNGRTVEDWARELDCSPAEARRALDNLIARGLIVECENAN